jgi:hypothetical protein
MSSCLTNVEIRTDRQRNVVVNSVLVAVAFDSFSSLPSTYIRKNSPPLKVIAA